MKDGCIRSRKPQKENPVLEDWNKIGYVSELRRFSAEYPGGRGEGLRASEDSERTLNKMEVPGGMEETKNSVRR